VLLLSKRYTVALRSEGLPGYDGAASRAPVLLGVRSSETKAVDFVTIANDGSSRSQSLQDPSPVIFFRLSPARAVGRVTNGEGS
jgi:hypothetical protein